MTEGNSDLFAQQLNGQEQEEIQNGIDLDKIIIVLKKSIFWIILIFAITFSSAFLYVRYTKPLYRSESTIKLDLQSEASIIGISNPLENPAIAGLSGEIELLKSDLFFDRVAKAINYDISYYYYGQILTEERYKNSPFAVSYKLKNQAFYDRRLDLEILDDENFLLTYTFNGKEHSHANRFGDELSNEHFNFLIEKNPLYSSTNGVGRYYFTINSDRALNSYFRRNILVAPDQLQCKNHSNFTRDHNKLKARDFVAAIDTVYLAYTTEQ